MNKRKSAALLFTPCCRHFAYPPRRRQAKTMARIGYLNPLSEPPSPNTDAGGESDQITARIEAIKAWVRTLFCRSDAAKVGTVRQRAADGIGEICAYESGGIGAVGIVRVVTGQLKFLTVLPPTVLATNHAGHDIGSDAGADFDGPVGTFNDHPLFVGDAEARGAVGMNI